MFSLLLHVNEHARLKCCSTSDWLYSAYTHCTPSILSWLESICYKQFSPFHQIHLSKTYIVLELRCLKLFWANRRWPPGNHRAPRQRQEINGGVSCYAASPLSHYCVIKSNPRTLLCGCCKLLSPPAFKDSLICHVSFATCCIYGLFFFFLKCAVMFIIHFLRSSHSTPVLEAYGRLSVSLVCTTAVWLTNLLFHTE